MFVMFIKSVQSKFTTTRQNCICVFHTFVNIYMIDGTTNFNFDSRMTLPKIIIASKGNTITLIWLRTKRIKYFFGTWNFFGDVCIMSTRVPCTNTNKYLVYILNTGNRFWFYGSVNHIDHKTKTIEYSNNLNNFPVIYMGWIVGNRTKYKRISFVVQQGSPIFYSTKIIEISNNLFSHHLIICFSEKCDWTHTKLS